MPDLLQLLGAVIVCCYFSLFMVALVYDQWRSGLLRRLEQKDRDEDRTED